MPRPDYKLDRRVQCLVDVLLCFHHRRMRAILRELARQFNQPECIVADIGTGAKPEGSRFPNALYVSTDYVPHRGIDLVTSATHLAIRDLTVDLVLCANVIEHLPEPDDMLTEARRILRIGGYLFLVTPFMFPLHDVPYDFFRYTEYSLRRLLKDYSEISVHRILWLPLPTRLAERFVLYYVLVAKK